MSARHPVATLFVASVTAIALTVAAGPSTLPTGHRQKLRRVPPLPHPPLDSATELGAPLVGLTPDQLAAFEAGREEFESIETSEGGLGPIFNDMSCASCHSGPVSGGAGTTTVTRFGRASGGHFDPLVEKGGSLLQARAIVPEAQESVPPEANVVGQRITTPLFGAGLLEAIPDEDILQNEKRNKADGVSGLLELRLTRDLNAELLMSDIRGQIRNLGVGLKLDSTEKGGFRSQLGAGGAPISISSINGDVVLRRD